MSLANPGNERHRRKAAGFVAVVLLFAGAGSATDDSSAGFPYKTLKDVPQLDPSDPMTTHKVILITDQGLNPSKVNLDPGQLIAWISYSVGESTVVFERDVARSMICHSRVNFAFEDGELRSAPIQAGEFASFCQLKPGHYRYKIVRSDPGSTLEGEIIVGSE